DVLDTWFSSALWPFSTLGWPEQTEDLKYFYPTDVLVTGYDIITFWVSRMITCGVEQMGETPFSTVLIHGLVRDEQGRKMSKSLGNGIDPIEIIDKFGADALRFSLMMGVAPGSDIRISEENIESYRNFCNKIWNAARFVLMNLEGWEPKGLPAADRLSAADKWILTKYQENVRSITQNFEDLDLGLAATKLYDFIWSNYCDWYIEMAKQTLNGEDKQAADDTREVLWHVLVGTMKLLHPYMPFITEEIYAHLPGTEGMLIAAQWPEADPAYDFADDAVKMEGVMDVVRAIRNMRAEMNVAPGKRARLIMRPTEGWASVLEAADPYFRRLAFGNGLELISADAPAPGKSASAVTACCEIYIPLGELVDIPKEIARLEKDKKNAEGEIARAEGKLNNQGFVSKAPAQLIENEKAKLETAKGMLASLESRIAELKEML
ncbi:MAG: class I tRNA ligase family protein, partial [Clostridia bacterium]|nr:class I tRNA ligase family protein [Clostridia bacterium]